MGVCSSAAKGEASVVVVIVVVVVVVAVVVCRCGQKGSDECGSVWF